VSGRADGTPGGLPHPVLKDGNSSVRRTRNRPPPKAGPVAVVFGVLVALAFAGIGGTLLVTGVREIGFRAGLAGQPGTVLAVECHYVGSGHNRSQSCDGYFQPGGVLVALNGTTDPGLRPRPARLHGDGRTASVTGVGPVAGSVAELLFGLDLAVAGLALLASMVITVLVRVRGPRGALGRPATARTRFWGRVLACALPGLICAALISYSLSLLLG
jgi:hypothetical protein